MSAFDWFLIVWWIFGTIMTVGVVGKPRKPIEPSTAAVIVIINLVFIAGLLWSRGAL